MSAYNVSDAHLVYLVSVFADLHTRDGHLCLTTGEAPTLDGVTPIGRQDILGRIHWDLDPNCHRGARVLLDRLARENRRSVASRYNEAEEPMPAHPRAFPIVRVRDVSSVARAIKALDCYEYQACEHDGWAASEVAAWCSQLRRALVRRIPGFEAAYEAAPWGAAVGGAA